MKVGTTCLLRWLWDKQTTMQYGSVGWGGGTAMHHRRLYCACNDAKR